MRFVVGASLVLACGCGELEMTGTTGGSESGDGGSADCRSIQDWPQDRVAVEQAVVDLVNEARASGGSCGGMSFAPSAPLRTQPALQCAARAHSLDMQERDFFAHDNPDGDSPFDRMEAAGYVYARAAENIAAGYRSAEAVVAGWLESPGHCANMLEPRFEDIGVGYVEGESPLWTQTFGTPR